MENLEKQILVKTIKRSYKDTIEAGIMWFKFITALSNIKVSNRELELLAFINYRGTISSVSAKEEFCKMFDSSVGTISNMAARLLKPDMKLLVKEKGKIRVNPELRVDFKNDLIVRMFIDVKPTITTNGN
jgi:hypothetical protein